MKKPPEGGQLTCRLSGADDAISKAGEGSMQAAFAGAVALALVVSGCAAARFQQQTAEFKAASDACAAAHKSGKLKTFHAAGECVNAAEERIINPKPAIAADLITQSEAERLVLDDAIDAGKMTEDQAKLAMAKFATQAVNVARQRQAQNEASEQRRIATLAVGLAAVQAIQPRQPAGPVFCNSIRQGAFVNTTCQ